MHDPTGLLERLEDAATKIEEAPGPSELFRALLDGLTACTPRAAVFLCRSRVLHGWELHGYGEGARERLRECALEIGRGWPGRLAAEDGPDHAFRETGERDTAVRLDARAHHESLGTALRVGGRTIAVVLAERDPDERPWEPAGLALLAKLARMRLEVDLARRRLQRTTSASPETAPARPAAPEDAPSVEDRTPPPEPQTPEFELDVAPDEPSPDVQPAGLAPAAPPEPVEGGAPDDAAARRFARLVATDIRLYNEEEVLVGRRNRDLGERMKEHLDRGRDTFRRRFPDLGEHGDRILEEAFVRVLAGGDADLLGVPGGVPDGETR